MCLLKILLGISLINVPIKYGSIPITLPLVISNASAKYINDAPLKTPISTHNCALVSIIRSLIKFPLVSPQRPPLSY